VNKEVVEATTQKSPETGGDDRDPKVIILHSEDIKAPPGKSGEESRTQVTSRIESIACLVAIRSANECDGEADYERLKIASRVVALI